MGACGVTPPLPGLRRLLDPELCLEVRGREPAGAEGEPPTAGPRDPVLTGCPQWEGVDE